MTPHEYLKSIGACNEARTWALQYDTMQAIIDGCDKIDWLARLIDHAGTMKQRVSFSCDAVRNTPLADGRKVWDLLTDERSRNAIVVGEAYARGGATEEERAAAGGAAWDAARDAAWGAAWAAAWDAAGAAARDATWAAAWAAAGDAAWDAAGGAARAAAGGAAGAAAWDAAGAAARGAAGAAAWAAAGGAQVIIARKHLHQFDWETLMQAKEGVTP